MISGLSGISGNSGIMGNGGSTPDGGFVILTANDETFTSSGQNYRVRIVSRGGNGGAGYEFDPGAGGGGGGGAVWEVVVFLAAGVWVALSDGEDATQLYLQGADPSNALAVTNADPGRDGVDPFNVAFGGPGASNFSPGVLTIIENVQFIPGDSGQDSQPDIEGNYTIGGRGGKSGNYGLDPALWGTSGDGGAGAINGTESSGFPGTNYGGGGGGGYDWAGGNAGGWRIRIDWPA